jgi:hypothetical protein
LAAPFISRADLTDILGRDVTADDGALIAVDAACDICRVVSEQTFNRATTTVTLDGTGTDALLLKERPVNTAGTVTIAGTAVTDYVVDTEHGILFRKVLGTDVDWTSDVPATEIKWPRGRQNVTVTYDHGYADADMPRDVRMVALSIAERLVIQGPAVFETLGDASVRYAGPQMDLTNTERFVLAKYRSR